MCNKIVTSFLLTDNIIGIIFPLKPFLLHDIYGMETRKLVNNDNIYIHIDIHVLVCIIFNFINNAHSVFWLNVVSTLAWESFTCLEMLPLLMKLYQITAFLCWTLSRKGSVLSHTCCDTGPQFLGVSSKGSSPHLVIFYDWQRIPRIDSDPDSQPIQNIKDQVFKLLTITIRSLIFIL